MDVRAFLRPAMVIGFLGFLGFLGGLVQARTLSVDDEPILPPIVQGAVHPLIDDLRVGDPIRLAIAGVDEAARSILFEVECAGGPGQASVDVGVAPFLHSDFLVALGTDGVAVSTTPHLGGEGNEPMILRWTGSPLRFQPGDHQVVVTVLDDKRSTLSRSAVELTVADYPAAWSERELAAAARSAVSMLLRRSQVEPGWLMITGMGEARTVGVITSDDAGLSQQYRVRLDSSGTPIAITVHPLTSDLFQALWPDDGELVFGPRLSTGNGRPRMSDAWENGGPLDSRISFEPFGPPGQITVQDWSGLQQAVRWAFIESVRPRTRKQSREQVMGSGATAVPALINALRGLDLSMERDLVNAGNLVLAVQDVSLDLVKIPLRLNIDEIEENQDFNVKVVHSLIRYWEKYDGRKIADFEEKLARQVERLNSMPDDW